MGEEGGALLHLFLLSGCVVYGISMNVHGGRSD